MKGLNKLLVACSIILLLLPLFGCRPTQTQAHIDPTQEKMALLVIDVENDVLDKEGKGHTASIWKYAEEHNTIENIAKAIELAEKKGIPIIRVHIEYAPGHPEIPDQGFWKLAKGVGVFEEGTWGADYVPGLEPKPGHLIVEKKRSSAFYNTELDRLLHELGINTLVLCGVSAHGCILFTFAGAIDRDYNVYVLRDCVAGPPELTDWLIWNEYTQFARIPSAEELLGK